jgi:hypothetical protein
VGFMSKSILWVHEQMHLVGSWGLKWVSDANVVNYDRLFVTAGSK